VETLLSALEPSRFALALEIARLPDMVRGFGPIKERNLARYAERRDELWARWPDRPEAPAPETPYLQAAE